MVVETISLSLASEVIKVAQVGFELMDAGEQIYDAHRIVYLVDGELQDVQRQLEELDVALYHDALLQVKRAVQEGQATICRARHILSKATVAGRIQWFLRNKQRFQNFLGLMSTVQGSLNAASSRLSDIRRSAPSIPDEKSALDKNGDGQDERPYYMDKRFPLPVLGSLDADFRPRRHQL